MISLPLWQRNWMIHRFAHVSPEPRKRRGKRKLFDYISGHFRHRSVHTKLHCVAVEAAADAKRQNHTCRVHALRIFQSAIVTASLHHSSRQGFRTMALRCQAAAGKSPVDFYRRYVCAWVHFAGGHLVGPLHLAFRTAVSSMERDRKRLFWDPL